MAQGREQGKALRMIPSQQCSSVEPAAKDSRFAIVIIGRSYPNILSILYESRDIPGCDAFVVRMRCERVSLRGRYLHMLPETKSARVKRHFLILGSDDEALWPKIRQAIDQVDSLGVYDKIIFFPVGDAPCLLLNRHKKEFSDKFVFHGVGEGGRGDCAWLSEKFKQKKLAEEFGIPVASGCLVTRAGNESYAGGFPCIVKVPQSLKAFTEMKGVVGICKDEGGLKSCIKKAWSYGLAEVLVEEFLPIDYELGMSGVCVNGKLLGLGAFRKRSVCTGVRLGNTISGEVIDVKADALLRDFAERLEQLLKRVEYNGIFDVDMACARGKYHLIEINLRVGAFTFSIVSAGVPLVGLYNDCLRGRVRDELVIPTCFGAPALNERALMEEMGVGQISLMKYLRELKRGKVRKIRNVIDPGPYRLFMRKSVWAWLSHMIRPVEPVFKGLYHSLGPRS